MMRRLLLYLVLAFTLLNACEADDKSATRLANLKIEGADIQVDRAPGKLSAGDADVLDWIKTGTRAVSHYYGVFPVKNLRIVVRPTGHTTGTTYGDEDGAYIRLDVGADDTSAELKSSWVITHEMVHLAFPQLKDNQHWAEEGQATYIEPIARAQISDLSIDYLWQETLEDMPQGLPDNGDAGLDHTASWGRTYWGGALFYLMADVAIRERTHNRYGLQDALAAVVAAGGNVQTSSTLENAFGVADKAVGVPVLEELYSQWKDKPVEVDLPALWKKLGVALKDGKVVYDDAAPDAAIRKAITSPATR